jgi:hypothetical protein
MAACDAAVVLRGLPSCEGASVVFLSPELYLNEQ